jgi:hypothetical protein
MFQPLSSQIFGLQVSIFSENVHLLKEVYPGFHTLHKSAPSKQAYPGTQQKAETPVQVKRSKTVPVLTFTLPG